MLVLRAPGSGCVAVLSADVKGVRGAAAMPLCFGQGGRHRVVGVVVVEVAVVVAVVVVVVVGGGCTCYCWWWWW